MVVPRFLKTVVGTVSNDIPPGAMNTFLTAGDVDGDGWPDVVVGGRNGRLVWLQNPRDPGIPWPMYVVGEPGRLECGGCLHDLLGRGRADIICGGDWRSDEIWWWENPGPAGGTWTQRIIAKTGHTQFHDTAIGDVTGDGTLSLVFTNQHPGTVIWGVPLPADPRVSPWPGLEAIAVERTEPNPHRPEGVQPDEGLAIGDVDGDGRNEVVCGCHWYKYSGHPGHPWEAHRFATSYITTKVAIGDVDGDGRNEIVLAEGDPYIYGRKEGGRLAWFRPEDDITGLWDEHVLMDGLLDAHTLQLADFCGNGRADILVGEIGAADPQTDAYIVRPPRLWLLEDLGKGCYAEHLIDEGTGIHDGCLADVDRRGVLDIIGRPLHGPEKWQVHVYRAL